MKTRLDAGAPACATKPSTYATRLLAWFDVAGRHDLPWQNPRTPYRVWLSEIMLQQTQVRTVIGYFDRFVSALPTVEALAAASLDDVLALWSGMGYYARARNLHETARACVERHGGDLPRDIEALVALPGIGRSTAAAIVSQAWGDRQAILDGNVKRVLSRFHGIEGWPGLPAVEKQLWAVAQSHLPVDRDASRMADYTQAQMDLGATLCTRAAPACVLCPLQSDCVARIQGLTGELPSAKPTKVSPRRQAHVLWLENDAGAVLLQRRPPQGVWASLWTLPQADDAAGARAWFDAHATGAFDAARPLPPIDHAFSHFRLQLQPLHVAGVALRPRVGDNDDLRWVARSQLATLGLPAPIRTLLEGSA